MPLPPPLVPTRTPTPTARSALSSTPSSTSRTVEASLFDSPPTRKTDHSPSTSIASPASSDFGAFVSSDPLHSSRLDNQKQHSMDPWDLAAAGSDFLDQARQRDAQRRESLLGVLDVGKDGLDGLSLIDNDKTHVSEQGKKAGGGYMRRNSSSFVGGGGGAGKLAMSPPRRLSHVMSVSPPKPIDYTHSIASRQADEPTPLVSPSNADLYHPSLQRRANSEDFFSPLVRQQSLDASRSGHTFSDAAARPLPGKEKLRKMSERFPSNKSSSLPADTSPSVRNSSNASQPISLLPNLIKQTSKWKSMLSSPTSHSGTPHQSSISSSIAANVPSYQSAHITHSNPFYTNPSSVYVPPSGAPGFVPHTNLLPQGGFPSAAQGGLGEARGVQLTGRRQETVGILTEEGAECLRPHLPPRLRLAGSWSLLYSLDQHGSSLGTLYGNCGKFEDERRRKDGSGAAVGNVLLMRSTRGEIFGGYVGEAIKKNVGYFGGGDCFLFKFHPFPNTVPGKESHLGGLEIFKWTGKNQYMCLCESTFMSLGGGDGKYGLYLDSQMYDGISQTCPAFDNEVLCSGPDGKFECVGVEVWGLPPPPHAPGEFFPEGNVLVLTSHPDDEVMFFSTALYRLHEYSRDVVGACMSTGNAEGLGETRKLELEKSYNVYGYKDVVSFDHPELQDGLNTTWSTDVIVSLIQPIINEKEISVIITFDSNGVSQHPNHKSLSDASLLLSAPSGSNLSVYHLSTLPIAVKYFSFLPSLSLALPNRLIHFFKVLTQAIPEGEDVYRPVPGQKPMERVDVAVSKDGFFKGVEAMREHSSQMVWFRWLYLAGSRYMWEGSYHLVSSDA
ncbi:Oxidation resistance protein [Phaffia rhodozyma]|uniref:Oxidation resistance protein 1 n=1 Tax=Phaffia rhodozyma TaxID=264483 RepID=A0A0F7SG47_PHARH|nr:Oxidation resistance protein [Phaffia rhodozyma]